MKKGGGRVVERGMGEIGRMKWKRVISRWGKSGGVRMMGMTVQCREWRGEFDVGGGWLRSGQGTEWWEWMGKKANGLVWRREGRG